MVTKLEDIARQLNLSTATVSRALNKDTEKLVKLETREKILEIVRQTGFKPNIKARSLAKGQLTNIFLVLSQLIEDSIFYDQYFINLIRGVLSIISDTDYSLSIVPIENDYTEEQIYNILLNNETAGLILSPYCSYLNFPLDLIERYRFPVISLDSELQGRNITSLMLNHFNAGYKGAEFLVNKGYKNIILISDEKKSEDGETRKKGFYQYFKDNPQEQCFVGQQKCTLSYISAQPMLDKIVESGKFPVGVFALSDEIGVGLISHMKEKGLKCPEDIGVLGFDALEIRKQAHPQLTSVGFAIREIGKLSAKMLLQAFAGKEMISKRTIEARIYEGGSC